jgi:hypothetical protein
LAVAVTLGLIAFVPSYYHREPRPLHDAVERLQPVRAKLHTPGSVLIASRLNEETCFYLADSFDRECTSPLWATLAARTTSGIPLGKVLDQAKATVIYADPSLLGDPSIAKLAAAPGRYGWRLVASGSGEDGPWRVLVRAT